MPENLTCDSNAAPSHGDAQSCPQPLSLGGLGGPDSDYSHGECFALILSFEADGRDALVASAEDGHAKCVQLLLEGAYMSLEADDDAALAKGGRGLISLRGGALADQFQALKFAAMNGHCKCVEALISAPGNDAASCAQALVLAASYGRRDCATLLLAQVSSPEICAQALRSAVIHGRAECLDLLLAKTCDTGLLSDLLYLAGQDGHNECIKALASGGGGLDDRACMELLAIAIHHGHVATAALMVEVCPRLIFLMSFPVLISEASAVGDEPMAAFLAALSERAALEASVGEMLLSGARRL